MRSRSWLRLTVSAVVVLSLLPGCSSLTRTVHRWTRNPLADVERQVGVRPVALGTDANQFGTLLFYEYQKGPDCGFGYDFTPTGDSGGSGGSSGQPCVANPPVLEFRGGGSSGGQNQATLSLYYGRIRDPKAVRVTMRTPDMAEPLEARVVGTVWYVMTLGKLDGKGPFEIKAYDQAGTLLHSTP